MSIRKILAALRKADYDYNMIEDQDHIAVGVSGGKDSMLLLHALKIYQKFPHKSFTFTAVFLDLGFGNTNIEALEQFCGKEDIPLHIEDSKDVFLILKQHEKNGLLPCSICSRMKKAAINKVAHLINASKVAFAHHADDAIETLLMNTIYGGRVASFNPKMFLSNTRLTFIRPFLYVREKEINQTISEENIPVIKSPCPNDKKTMREECKNMLNYIYHNYKESYSNFLTMLNDDEHFDLWFNHIDHPLYPYKGFHFHKVQITSDALLLNRFRFNHQRLEYLENEDEDNIHYLLYSYDNLVATLTLKMNVEEKTLSINELIYDCSIAITKQFIKVVENTFVLLYTPLNITYLDKDIIELLGVNQLYLKTPHNIL